MAIPLIRTPGGDQISQALMQLLQKYGTVSQIPSNELAKIGLSPEQAQYLAATLPEPDVQNGNIADAQINTLGTVVPNPSTGSRGGILGILGDTPSNWTPIKGTPTRAQPPAQKSSLADVLGNTGWGTASSIGAAIASIGKGIRDNLIHPEEQMARNQPTNAEENALHNNPGPTNTGGDASWGGGQISDIPRAPAIPEGISNIPNASAGGAQYSDIPNASVGDDGGFNYVPTAPAPTFDLTPPAPPEFKLNDFTGPANKMVAKAYSPQYAALNAAQAQVNQNYDTAKKIVDGLYAQAATNIGQNTKDINTGYRNAQKENAQSTAGLQQQIGDTYGASQQQLADLIKQLGGGPKTGAAILPQGQLDQAYFQSQAAQRGSNQSDYLTNQQLGTQDYQKAIGQAVGQEGRVQQQNLLQDKSNQLSDLSQQRLGVASNQSLQALSLANQLQQQDFGLQQANYGAGQDYFNNLLGAQGMQNQIQQIANQNSQFNANLGLQRDQMAQQGSQFDRQMDAQAQNDAYNQALQKYQLEYQKYRDMVGDSQQAAQLALAAMDQSQKNALAQGQLQVDQYNANTGRLNANTNAAQARAQLEAAGQKAAGQTDSESQKWFQSIVQMTGNTADANSIRNMVIASINDAGPNSNPRAFAQSVQDKLNKITPDTNPNKQLILQAAYNAAIDYYTSSMGVGLPTGATPGLGSIGGG